VIEIAASPEGRPTPAHCRPLQGHQRVLQRLGGRIKHGRTVNDGGLTKPFWAFVSRPAVTRLVYASCGSTDPAPWEASMGSPFPRAFHASPRPVRLRIRGGVVNNINNTEGQKRAVNPLTRFASRSEMYPSYSVAAR
jgi:hypothetical protein